VKVCEVDCELFTGYTAMFFTRLLNIIKLTAEQDLFGLIKAFPCYTLVYNVSAATNVRDYSGTCLQAMPVHLVED